MLASKRTNNRTMRTLVSTSVFAFALLAGLPLGVQTAGAGQQPEEAKASSVVAEARKALGGEDKLAAVKRLQVNGTTKRANGNFNLEGDTELFLELPDKFRRNESLTLGSGGGDRRSNAKRFSTAPSSRPRSAATSAAVAALVAVPQVAVPQVAVRVVPVPMAGPGALRLRRLRSVCESFSVAICRVRSAGFSSRCC